VNADEIDITDVLIKNGGNEGNISIIADTDLEDTLNNMGFTWANNCVRTPNGTVAVIKDRTNQLADGEAVTGVSINIPLDKPSADNYKGVIGTEHTLALTPAMIGQNAYDSLATFLKDARENGSPKIMQSDDGFDYYVAYDAQEVFGDLGISVMCRFSDGEELDASEVFMLGIRYDEDAFAEGKIFITFGISLADYSPYQGAYWQDFTEMLSAPYKVALLFDGNGDDSAIAFSYWLAKNNNNTGNGGCNAGALGIFGIGLLACLWKKTKISAK
jgi:hypothetical protein